MGLSLELTLPEKLPSRILINLEGVEAFVFNRTPAYDAIIERMKKHERQEKEQSDGLDADGHGAKASGVADPGKENPITMRFRKAYKAAKGTGAEEERLEALNSNDSSCEYKRNPSDHPAAQLTDCQAADSSKVREVPNAIKPVETPKPTTVDWFREMLPIDLKVQTGSVILGSDATPMLLIGDFKRAEGTLEITEVRESALLRACLMLICSLGPSVTNTSSPSISSSNSPKCSIDPTSNGQGPFSPTARKFTTA